jgi:ribosomal protein S12 methylthiotransferase accessory factor YcaO
MLMSISRLLPSPTPVTVWAWASHLRYYGGLSYVAGNSRINGSGVGHPLQALQAGVGEYLERKMLLSGIVPDQELELSEMGERGHRLRHMLGQLSDTAGLERHRFKCTSCVDRNGNDVPYPTLLLSLSSLGLEDDAQFISFACSSGSALHGSRTRALTGAVGEFFERQILVALWLGADATELMVDSADLGSTVSHYYRLLSHAGCIRIFTVDSPVGGYFCLALYSSRGKVKYSVGASFALDPHRALEKSIAELWHGVLYVASNTGKPRTDEVLDVLKAGFLAANSSTSAERFFCWQSPRSTLNSADFLKGELQSLDGLFGRWDALSQDRVILDRPVGAHHFCRVADPGFYAHMNPGVALNFDNAFGRVYGVCEPMASQRNMIPFP